MRQIEILASLSTVPKMATFHTSGQDHIDAMGDTLSYLAEEKRGQRISRVLIRLKHAFPFEAWHKRTGRLQHRLSLGVFYYGIRELIKACKVQEVRVEVDKDARHLRSFEQDMNNMVGMTATLQTAACELCQTERNFNLVDDSDEGKPQGLAHILDGSKHESNNTDEIPNSRATTLSWNAGKGRSLIAPDGGIEVPLCDVSLCYNCQKETPKSTQSGWETSSEPQSIWDIPENEPFL